MEYFVSCNSQCALSPFFSHICNNNITRTTFILLPKSKDAREEDECCTHIRFPWAHVFMLLAQQASHYNPITIEHTADE